MLQPFNLFTAGSHIHLSSKLKPSFLPHVSIPSFDIWEIRDDICSSRSSCWRQSCWLTLNSPLLTAYMQNTFLHSHSGNGYVFKLPSKAETLPALDFKCISRTSEITDAAVCLLSFNTPPRVWLYNRHTHPTQITAKLCCRPFSPQGFVSHKKYSARQREICW